jgi:2-aminoethylphosphonate-pyruvate transaminase
MNDAPVLLNPGPVTLTQSVRKALTGPDQCHREPEFAELTRSILRGLETVYPSAGNDYRAVLLATSGTGAVEAMLNSLAPRDASTLVVCNGVYGERMRSMLEAQGKPHLVVDSGWMNSIDPSKVEDALNSDPGIRQMVVVHHETTTGRLNDLKPLGDLCREHSCGLMVDAVSSFGAEEIDFESLPISAVAGTANKCLHGVPGSAFVLVNAELLSTGSTHSPSVYLDLYRYAAQQETGFSPFTQPVQCLYALQAALKELQESGGCSARRKLYLQRSKMLREHLATLGVKTLLEGGVYSSMLTSFELPEDLDYESFHDRLKADGFITYAGQGDLKDRVFRLATMGELPEATMHRLCVSLTDTFDH